LLVVASSLRLMLTMVLLSVSQMIPLMLLQVVLQLIATRALLQQLLLLAPLMLVMSFMMRMYRSQFASQIKEFGNAKVWTEFDLREYLTDPVHTESVQHKVDGQHEQTQRAVMSQEKFPLVVVKIFEEIAIQATDEDLPHVFVFNCTTGYHRTDVACRQLQDMLNAATMGPRRDRCYNAQFFPTIDAKNSSQPSRYAYAASMSRPSARKNFMLMLV
jgi:hypothetical protein